MNTLTPDETILGLLASRPAHGYHLLESFHDPAQLGEVWKLSTSQLYAVLKRLEKQGAIQGVERESADAPTRTEYYITAAGEARLAQWLDNPQPSASVRCVRVEFLSRLYIARLLGIPTQPLVKRQKQACSQRYHELVAQRATAPLGMGFLTLDLVVTQMEGIIAWLDRTELMPRFAEALADEETE